MSRISTFNCVVRSVRALCAVALLTPLVALAATPSPASAYSVQYCAPIPIVGGIPPWGFHTGAPITGATGSYARGHGDINLRTRRISGIICQVDRPRNQPDRLIVLTVLPHLLYYSHVQMRWGYPGNEIRFLVKVKSSTDPGCKVGTVGKVIEFGSYNGVRSDSVQFIWPKSSCYSHRHLYHGPQVNNQVPPA